MPLDYPVPFNQLTRELRRLPGLGPRSAERCALWLLGHKDARPAQLAEAITCAAAAIHPCRECGFFAEEELCGICSQLARQDKELCVVEQATDILPLERSGVFGGLYHALGGRLAPLDHIGPDQLRIESLLRRIKKTAPPR
jgi:recombination protein RecR